MISEDHRLTTSEDAWEQQEQISPKLFEVWAIETPVFRGDTLAEARELRIRERMAGMREVQREYNRSVVDHESGRTLVLRDFDQKTLAFELSRISDKQACLREIPDVVVVFGDDAGVGKGELAEAYVRQETGIISDIRAAVDAYHFAKHNLGRDFRLDPVENRRFDEDLQMVFADVYTKTCRKKGELTDATALDSGFAQLFLDEEDPGYRRMNESVYEYLRTANPESLEAVFTDEVLQEAYAAMTCVDPGFLNEEYANWREYEQRDQKAFANKREYIAYRTGLAEVGSHMDLDSVKEQMRKRYIELLRQGINGFAQDFWWREDSERWDHRVLQPVIVSVSSNPEYQKHALEAGANLLVPETLSFTDATQLFQLANRMKNSPASLARERLERQKGKFYHDVEGEIEERSELTADTEKELAILEGILQGVGAQDVLDVGCGFGRIAVPLAVQGYRVTGLDGNQALLERAREQSGTQGVSMQFLQGDIIEYKRTVDAEAFDAVTYTWHTILEAYGMGNTLETLTSAWRALRPGGTLVFDQPSRENTGMEAGQYGDPEHEGYGGAYLMDQDELRFVLRMAGFENVEIIPWTTKPTELYPEGMKKWTIVAKKMKK